MSSPQLIAYKVSSTDNWTLVPAPAKRQWMDETHDRFAYRCLPLVIANSSGWLVTSPLDLVAIWDGGASPEALSVSFPSGEGINAGQIRSNFGSGILTFSLPWLFRTSAGMGLWCHGPANWPKDNLQPLEGVIETDWAPYTFTMNWKILRPNTPAVFRKGDPVCMLTPFPLDLLESVTPELREIASDPLLEADFKAFCAARQSVITARVEGRPADYQMDYMRGHMPDGTLVTSHRRALKLAEFRDAPPR
ncbi:MAG: DUF6065 family protein [Planctomycetota bacterium]|nr:DUF6065 family protein [Planctomycetota bacterium]